MTKLPSAPPQLMGGGRANRRLYQKCAQHLRAKLIILFVSVDTAGVAP